MVWWNTNAPALSLAATVVLALLTAAYVIATFRMLRQTRETQEENAKPLLSVRAVLDPYLFHIFNLKVENVGGGPAQSVLLTVTNPPLHPLVEHLNENGAFRRGIARLNRGEYVQFFLANAIGMPEELWNRPIQITATFKDIKGKQDENYFIVDFKEVQHFQRVGDPPIVTLADSSKSMKEDVQRLASGFSKLHVVVTTEKEERLNRQVTNQWAQIQMIKHKDPAGAQEIENLIKSKFDAVKGR